MEALGGCHANQASRNRRVKAECFVNDGIEMLTALEFSMVDVVAGHDGCHFFTERFQRFRVLDELVGAKCESRGCGVTRRH